MRELEIFPVFYSCLFVNLHALLGERVVWFMPVFFCAPIVYLLASLFWGPGDWRKSMTIVFLLIVAVFMLLGLFSYSFFFIYGLALGASLFFLGAACLFLALAWGRYYPCFFIPS
jgi:hypothetical protein